MFIPPPYVATKKCTRCELSFKAEESKCTHCSELNDNEVIKLKLKYAHEKKNNAILGKYFIFTSFILLIGFVYYLE